MSPAIQAIFRTDLSHFSVELSSSTMSIYRSVADDLNALAVKNGLSNEAMVASFEHSSIDLLVIAEHLGVAIDKSTKETLVAAPIDDEYVLEAETAPPGNRPALRQQLRLRIIHHWASRFSALAKIGYVSSADVGIVAKLHESLCKL